MEPTYLESLTTVLRSRPDKVDRLDPGLADAEIDGLENRFHFRFPPDLRAMLQFALPIGKQWPAWRTESDDAIQMRFDWPLHGLEFDVESNGFWLDAWGPKPPLSSGRRDLLRRVLDSAPRLIPIYSHRFVPAEPLDVGNPVFSVHQTDIIVYGNDLADYFHQEFRVPLLESAAREPRSIRFWSDALSWWDQERNYRR
jgi:hypothetical protein